MSMEYGILMYLDTKLRKEIEILAKMSFMVILAVPYVQKVNFLPQTFLSVFWKLIGLLTPPCSILCPEKSRSLENVSRKNISYTFGHFIPSFKTTIYFKMILEVQRKTAVKKFHTIFLMHFFSCTFVITHF